MCEAPSSAFGTFSRQREKGRELRDALQLDGDRRRQRGDAQGGAAWRAGGVGEMLENMGHRAESILEKTFEGLRGEDNLWKRFTRYEKTAPGKAAVGNIHSTSSSCPSRNSCLATAGMRSAPPSPFVEIPHQEVISCPTQA